MIDSFTSFLRNVEFSGSFRFLVTIDPAYGVPDGERAQVDAFLHGLADLDDRVGEVVVDAFDHRVGLERALLMLFSRTREEFGFHLEDDWSITGAIDLDALVADLVDTGSTEIALANSHAARGGTFDEAEDVPGTRTPLTRLPAGSWAAGYLPLCPHLHRTATWVPLVARALVTGDPHRCPDERVKEHAAERGISAREHVLWTREVRARDLGRAWLAGAGLQRAVSAGQHAAAPSAPAPPRERAALALPRSTAAARRTAAVVPGGSQTYQKRASLYGAPDGFPGVLDRGRGAVVWDLDGQHYVDFVCGLGTTTLGHAHPAVVNTVRERVGRGVSFSLPTAVEGLVAELLTRTVPGAERVRFFKTGAESCSAALRLARARTGRDEVLLVGYHGWHDGLGARGAGTPAAVAGLGRRVDLDDPADDERLLDRVRTDGDRLAAVLFAAPYHRRVPGDVVAALRAETARRGALLVMDEIVTAFRLAPGGVSELTGVRPDLVCLSKGLAAGMPLAALVGTADAMAGMGDLHVSTTFGGEVLSLYVARAALGVYAGTDYYDRIAALGRRLREGVNTAARRRGLDDVVTGHDPMPFLVPPPGAGGRAGFSAALAARGHLVRSGVNFLNAAHTPDQVDALVDAVAATLDEPATA